MTYEEIVQKWQKAKLPANIFSGNLLTVLTSEISKIEGINVSYHRTHELLENEYVAGTLEIFEFILCAQQQNTR